MDLLILENRIRHIEKSVYELQMEIQSLKKEEKRLTLEEVTAAIERDLPESLDLDHILQDMRER